jgi:quinoprotein glucose dehydrogenase
MNARALVLRALPLMAWCWCAPGQTASPGDWSSYGYDQGGGRYSPLAQITPDNVRALRPLWIYHMNPHDADSQKIDASFGSEQTPLVVNGVMYVGTPYGRVVALDADTGRELWVYRLPTGHEPSTRGLAYWPGGGSHPPEVIFGTDHGLLIAINAGTGLPVEGFGDHGIVNLKTPDVMNGFPNGDYGTTAPYNIYKNVVILNSRVQEQPPQGPSGDVRAVDARTGKFLWTFHTVPRPGERFHETWEGDSWKNRSGVNVWNMNTVDVQRGIAYLAIAAPAVDKDGSDRHGLNLFSDAIVAVDAMTGKYLWHFQVTHHEIWDYDMDTPPTLLEVKRNGRTIPAVAAMNKTGLLFLLNRVTGKPLYPVTEVPVPASTVPGVDAWPTQPVPSKPVQLTRSHFSLDEVATVTPELHDYCQGLIDSQGVQSTTERYTPLASTHPIVNFPANEGGPEWAGGSFDPNNGLLILNTNEYGYIMKLVPSQKGSGWGSVAQRFSDDKVQPKMLCQQPPWGDLTAVNVNTGEIAWRHNFGVTESLPPEKQNTGRPNTGGPITTASGLIFIGATDDNWFHAYRTTTGEPLWSYKLDYAGHATPITYQGKSGRQYVAIVATGGTYLFTKSGGDSLTAFALPATGDPAQPQVTGGAGTSAPAAGPTISAQDLAQGPGRDEVATLCSKCHALGTVVAVPHTADAWKVSIANMRAHGALMDDTTAARLAAYLTQHYGLHTQ